MVDNTDINDKQVMLARDKVKLQTFDSHDSGFVSITKIK